MLRIVLFIATNLAILLMASVIMTLLGVSPSDLPGLVIFGLCLGFGGALLSLAISKPMAKWTMKLNVIDPQRPANSQQAWLLNTVQSQARKAGIGMPEVAIWPSADINAFATGARRNNALVAVSQGLLDNMPANEVEAVLAHEVSHISNGDMVTMTLLQGVLNTFVIVLSRLLTQRLSGGARLLAIIALDICLGILASMIVMWFSRRREFRADNGGAKLAGTQNMISALNTLRRVSQPSQLPDTIAAFGVRSGQMHGWRRLFMSHPPLEERIAALNSGKIIP